jgi:LysR family transcriptional regulator, hydrogen peroxide-inducible genes activator
MRLSPHPVSLRQLQYVVAVGDHHSFRKAAELCHVSQPALSAQIAHLEAALGIKLFDRDTQRVIITSSGHEFLARARSVLISADELVDAALRDADPLSGPMRLGVIPTIGPYLVPKAMTPLRKGFPNLRFLWREERTETLMRLLRDGELDGAIVALEAAALTEVQSLVLGRDPFLLATATDHRLAAGDGPVSPKVLDHELVLVLEEGHCLSDQVADFCRRARHSQLDVRATSLATLSQMVVGGAGVTLLPALAVSVENRLGTLHLRPFVEKAPGRTIALVWRKGTPAQAALKAIAPALRKAVG